MILPREKDRRELPAEPKPRLAGGPTTFLEFLLSRLNLDNLIDALVLRNRKAILACNGRSHESGARVSCHLITILHGYVPSTDEVPSPEVLH